MRYSLCYTTLKPTDIGGSIHQYELAKFLTLTSGEAAAVANQTVKVADIAVFMPDKGGAGETHGFRRGDVMVWADLQENGAALPDTVASFDQVELVFDSSRRTGKKIRIYVLRVAAGDSPAHTFALTLARATETFMPLDTTLFRHRLYKPYYILIHILIILSILYPSSEILLKHNSFGNYVFVRDDGSIFN